jgi:hypothetical protein
MSFRRSEFMTAPIGSEEHVRRIRGARSRSQEPPELDEATEALVLAEDGRSPHPTPPSSAGSAARLWSAAGSARGTSAGSADAVDGGVGRRQTVKFSDSVSAPRSAEARSRAAGSSAEDIREEEDENGAAGGDAASVGSIPSAAVGAVVFVFSHAVDEPHSASDVVSLEVFSTAEKAREFMRWTILERRSDVNYADALKSVRARLRKARVDELQSAGQRPLRAHSGAKTSQRAASMRIRISGGGPGGKAVFNDGTDAKDTAALEALMSGELGAEARFFELGTGSMWERPSCTETWDELGQGSVTFHEGGDNGEFAEVYKIEGKEIY